VKHYLRIILLSILTIGILVACTEAAPPTSTPIPTVNVHTAIAIPPTEPAAAMEIAQPVWQTPLTAAVNVTPVVIDDLVIVATADGNIHAINAATGAPVWRFESEARLWDASLRAADGIMVCAGRQGGLLTCLDTATGSTLWTAELGLEVQSRPALVNGRLYAPATHVGTSLDNNYEGQASLFALDAATGDILWEAVTDNYILRRPIVAGDLVITGGTHLSEESGDNPPTLIYAFDSATGEERWRYESDDGLIRWLAAVDEVVVFSGSSEIVHALSLATGERLWSFGPSYWMQFPAIADNTLFLGSGDERFHALDAATGEHLWETRIDLDSLNQIGRPLLKGDWIVFNAVTGDVYALQQANGEQILHLETGISARVGGALYQNTYIMGDAEGVLYAYSLGE
jgi:hypothetical protein